MLFFQELLLNACHVKFPAWYCNGIQGGAEVFEPPSCFLLYLTASSRKSAGILSHIPIPAELLFWGSKGGFQQSRKHSQTLAQPSSL